MELADDIAYLAQFAQGPTARDLGVTGRAWRNLIKGVSQPRRKTADRVREVAQDYRLNPDASRSDPEARASQCLGCGTLAPARLIYSALRVIIFGRRTLGWGTG